MDSVQWRNTSFRVSRLTKMANFVCPGAPHARKFSQFLILMSDIWGFITLPSCLPGTKQPDHTPPSQKKLFTGGSSPYFEAPMHSCVAKQQGVRLKFLLFIESQDFARKMHQPFCPINFFQTVNTNMRRTLLLCGHRLRLLSGCRSKGRRYRLRRNHLLRATSSLRLGVIEDLILNAVCKMLEEQTIRTKFILD